MARDSAAQVLNARWVSEITYIFTQEGWLYLAVVLDVCSRQVIHWSMQSQLTRGLVFQAVLMAIWQRWSVDRVILNFDRGTQ